MMTATRSEKLTAFIHAFPNPANSFQKKMLENLLELDFPTTRNEYWKYTRVSKIQQSKLRLPTAGLLTSAALVDVIRKPNYLVFENGIFRADLSSCTCKGVNISVVDPEKISDYPKLNSQVDQRHIFTALNSTYFNHAIAITVEPKVEMTSAVQLIFVTCGTAVFANPRLLMDIQESAKALFTASFLSVDAIGSFNNVVSEFFVADHAQLVFDKIQNESEGQFHISTEEIVQEKNSNFKINTLTLDGGLVRNNINVSVIGENCETHMNGAVIARASMHVDNHTFVNHQVAHCFSNENYKYVLDEKSIGVFNGKVIVQQHAQKINAYQKNANILLSDFAQIDSKPELEIYADDVKCSHGSTTGQLDEEAVFYLQARGISKERARKLLVGAFVEEIIENFADEETKQLIHQVLIQKHDWTASV